MFSLGQFDSGANKLSCVKMYITIVLSKLKYDFLVSPPTGREALETTLYIQFSGWLYFCIRQLSCEAFIPASHQFLSYVDYCTLDGETSEATNLFELISHPPLSHG